MQPHYHIKDLIFFVRQRSSDIPILREVIQQETYFFGEKLIMPGDVVVDIGSHIGSFCIYAASFGAAVIAYEPTTINFDLLSKNVDINGYPVTIYKKAVRRYCGSDVIFIRPFNYGGTSFFNSPTQNPEFREVVDFVDLKTVFEENHLDHIDFLKLDCEDSELEILQSSIDLLPQISRIAIEWVTQKRRNAIKELLSDYNLHEKGNETMGIILAIRK